MGHVPITHTMILSFFNVKNVFFFLFWSELILTLRTVFERSKVRASDPAGEDWRRRSHNSWKRDGCVTERSFFLLGFAGLRWSLAWRNHRTSLLPSPIGMFLLRFPFNFLLYVYRRILLGLELEIYGARNYKKLKKRNQWIGKIVLQVFSLSITGHLEEVFDAEHRKEMLRYIYCHQVLSMIGSDIRDPHRTNCVVP